MKKMILIACFLVLALSACGSETGTTSSPAVATSAPTATPTATPKSTQPPKWTTVQKFSGNGTKKTGNFTVPDSWQILWSCDNTGQNYGIDGVMYISVYGSDGTPIDPAAVSGTCKAGKVTKDSTEEHQGGQVYLDINSSLSWTIQVQVLK